MNDWQEVPAWQAFEVLTKKTHDAEWFNPTSKEWIPIGPRTQLIYDDLCRIRPKRRTMDVKGLPVPSATTRIMPSQPIGLFSACKYVVFLEYDTDDQAGQAMRILEAAREAQ